MTTYARTEIKFAPLASDFGKSFVARRYGEAGAALIYSLLPKFSRGPRKGLVKGYVRWTKVHSGGWVRNAYNISGGHVELPGTRNVCILAGRDDFASGLTERDDHAACTDEVWLNVIRYAISTLFNLPLTKAPDVLTGDNAASHAAQVQKWVDAAEKETA